MAVFETEFLETTNIGSPIRKETNLASSHDSQHLGVTNISYAPSNSRARRIKLVLKKLNSRTIRVPFTLKGNKTDEK